MIPRIIGASHSRMPIVHGEPSRPTAGLSPRAQALWLAAVRHRQLADEAARKAAQ